MSGGVVSGREALAAALSERFGWPTEKEWEEQPEDMREGWRADADALLASGAVREEAAVRAEALAPIKSLADEWALTAFPDEATANSMRLDLAYILRKAIAPQDPA